MEGRSYLPESLEKRLAEHTNLYVDKFNDIYYDGITDTTHENFEVRDPKRMVAYVDRVSKILGIDPENTEEYLAVYQSMQFGYRVSCELGWRPSEYDFDTYLLEMWNEPIEEQRKKVLHDIDEYVMYRPQLDSFIMTYMPAIDPTGDRCNHICNESALLTLMMADRSLQYAHQDREIEDFSRQLDSFDGRDLN